MPTVSTVVSALLIAITLTQAQTTTATPSLSPSQFSKALSDANAYGYSVATQAHVQSIISQLSTVLPPASLSSVLATLGDAGGLFYGLAPTTSVATNVFLASFATAPPTSLITPAWVTGLPSDVRSAVEGLQTSIVKADASILRSDLSLNGAMPTGAPGYAKAVGVVAGAVGFAAAML